MEIKNKKANFDYEVLDTIEAGIVLTGTEIKSLRDGKAQIKDSYAIIRNNEAYILNMHISRYDEGSTFNHEETRTRKLLFHKKQILKLNDSIRLDGFTLVPLKVYLSKNKAKVLIGICKGKKTYDKRETIKKRDLDRELKKDLKRI